MQKSFNSDDYITANPITFTEDMDIYDAIHLLLENKVSGGTVINDAKEVIGILSEMDCLKAIINSGYYNQGGGRVKDFMTYENIALMDPHLPIVDAAQKLLDTKHRRMPVVEGGKLTGQISARSLLSAFVSAAGYGSKES